MDKGFKNRKFVKPDEPIPYAKVMPQDLKAEQYILAAMIQRPDVIDTVLDFVKADDFYREAHRRIFKAIIEVHEKHEPVDIITLSNELKVSGDFELVGGNQTIVGLLEAEPKAGNVEYYANIVKGKQALRGLISAGTQAVSEAYEENGTVKEILDSAEARFLEATEQRQTKGFRAVKEIIGDVFEDLSKTKEQSKRIKGLATGFEELDLLTGGLRDSNLIVIGARPGVGKTAMAMNIAWNVASEDKTPVGVFSIEMTEQELGARLLCSVAKVNLKEAERGETLDSDRQRMLSATAKIHETPIYLNDSSELTVLELKASARRLKKLYDVKLLVVDYLQLLRPGVQKDNREQEIAFISGQLKALAKNLKVPIICLSQLSRPGKGLENKEPVLSDLRESGAIEQDADVVIFIHRTPDYKHRLILAKQRNGPTDSFGIKFERWCTRFESLKPEDKKPVEKTEEEKEREYA